ncbi:tryptophan--tRNA ligase [Candidatus Adlerbacteria bacterium RIFCSPHIGHO2_01_FULL_54_23]|uniref:Tryptophan--tRNA ligase n=3 Tax=Candidatus Adleribacteriota TaxID=1752736 RepID=A0A1F4Y2Q7_9BACT|nr:MAG: Tryptophan-tRNA ligase [Candidatus Adlerbacteria bacterium GW2011_GWA1_54_10]KKW37966.1 MAG: Tryptophan-tRNA ligase [Candidatus Adlerbacteria bacterium GW2011_GWB1_54_7]OGC78574.1 MAG: tryptophan--tRNA ligase [Candidatus Adlerbacteria bacterium RIFCSPHIGHO2_01_FULL_54_23]OGC87583.1 MAG: tryptophan--tRNA ligase [Candidatus Adlerbacteria bacterium RIFCSPLOWO2_01_FULL_54_16]
MEAKKRLFTGLQPSGQLHIGNYFGALKPFADIYDKHESFLMVADYHALTSLKDPVRLREGIIDVVKNYVAAGVDPQKAVIFKQSDIQEHTELAWIFECLVTVPFLMQAHAYKDKVVKGLEANAGLFNYPMLMAADILLYDTDVVPVGEDQRQHVEYAREAAAKFNLGFGQTFKEPQEKILTGIGTVPGIDGKKMSKSYGNTIPLFGSKDEISKAVMNIVTDSSGERPAIVYAIHKLFRTDVELEPLYDTNKGNYKALKEALVEDIEKFIAPMRERRTNISDEEVKNILQDGADKARAVASSKMREVRQKVGVAL